MTATTGRGFLPQLPLVLRDNIDTEEQVRYCVGRDAVPNVFGARHEPSDQAEPDGGCKQFAWVHEHRNGGADDGCRRRECAKGDGPPSFAHDEAHQEAAEEELLDNRYDESEAEEADRQEHIAPGGSGRELVEWIEGRAIAEAEQFFETERNEKFALDLQFAQSDPEDDANDADADC